MKEPIISELSSSIHQDSDGIWYPNIISDVSYPNEGYNDSLKIQESSFWYQHRNNCLLECINKFRPNGCIFDIGGGTGYISSYLQEHGYITALIEPGLQGAKIANDRGLKNVICSTLHECDFSRDSLPAIGMFDVLEHIEDDIEAINYIYKLLIPGGLFYITVPSYNLLWSRDDIYAGHYRRYTLTGLNRKLVTAGFDILYKTYMFTFLPIPIFFLRSLPSLFGIIGRYSYNKNFNEHNKTNRLLDRILKYEISRIRSGKTLPHGSSCLIIANKPHTKP